MDNKKYAEFKKRFDEFKSSLKDMDLEALKKLEEEVVAECDKVDKEVRAMKFKLEKKGQEEAAKNIRMLLDTQQIQWQYTLGMVGLYEFWDGNQKEVDYDLLDATLRTLGNMQYTGYNHWKAVVQINDYMSCVQDKYGDATNKIFFMAEKHNAVMEAMTLKDPNAVNKNQEAQA